MDLDNIDAVKISLLDPDKFIRSAFGEVRNPKTIDTKGKPVIGGLFCPKIFGPMEPGTCLCGIYHPGYKRRVIQCKECDTVILNDSAKKTRFGTITLEYPAVHIWFRSIIATLLNIPPKKISDVMSWSAFIITDPGNTRLEEHEIIPLRAYLEMKRSGEYTFDAGTGGAVIRHLLEELDIKALVANLRKETPSRRVNKRLLMARDFLLSGVKPEWMVLKVIPVLPPGLRPIVFMDDGTVASSDLNELYAKVIHRNNRIKRMNHFGAPEILKLTDMRLLQNAVDALFLNTRGHSATTRSTKRKLKSISEFLGKKEGILRRNLIGKRVDYSGRSVIVVGPTLKLHQCGLPIELALDMFRPFIYGRLLKNRLATSLRHACKLVDGRSPHAVDALEEEIKKKVVLLNRAPSLHRMSIQGFKPILVSGRAIRLHPLVCAAFNADFDGDQMGVHIPVSIEAQIEARVLMLSVNNLFSPANGELIIAPAQDIVLGIYYLTKMSPVSKGEGMTFSDREDALLAYDSGVINLHSQIKVRMEGSHVITTPGRLILSEVFPFEMPFETLNQTMKKKDLCRLVEMCYRKAGHKAAVVLLDQLKELGFKYATVSGISFCIDDITIPREKREIIMRTEAEAGEIMVQYSSGVITDTERHNKIIAIWEKATQEISEKLMENFGLPDEHLTSEKKKNLKEFNSIFMMADSGARGSVGQISQIGGMRGLMAKPNGEVVEIPIKSNLKEGLSYHEYLLASHGARKGRADGALKTANAGHFTRRLIDVAYDVVVNEKDCGTLKGISISTLLDRDEAIISVEERIFGRYAAQDIRCPKTGNLIVRKNEIIKKDTACAIVSAGISEVKVRSPFTCKSEKGVCIKCYGHDLSTGRDVEIGDAVGIIAAQSIGEPGTQLTLRTFHSGGSASGLAVKSSISAKVKGHVIFSGVKTVTADNRKLVVINRNGRIEVEAEDGKRIDLGKVPYGSILFFNHSDLVDIGEKIVEWDPYNLPIISTAEGSANFLGIIDGVTIQHEVDADTGVIRKKVVAIHDDSVPMVVIEGKEYRLPLGAIINIDEEDYVHMGDVIAKIPKQQTKTSDITGGLPKVLQFFEARSYESPAILAEINGEIGFHTPKGKQQTVEIRGKHGECVRCQIQMERQVNFYDGDEVKAGDIIADGEVDPKDILAIFGTERTAMFTIDQVQKVYRSQGVEINDRHFEIIMRKMLSFVKILYPGDTNFVTDEIVSKNRFSKVNHETDGRKATATNILLGLTKTALLSDSWLGAASFERTPSVLAQAAVRGKIDNLAGAKENVILGKKVPLGTGHVHYENMEVLN